MVFTPLLPRLIEEGCDNSRISKHPTIQSEDDLFPYLWMREVYKSKHN